MRSKRGDTWPAAHAAAGEEAEEARRPVVEARDFVSRSPRKFAAAAKIAEH